jgi:transglutaminase-like putative cysteine protease
MTGRRAAAILLPAATVLAVGLSAAPWLHAYQITGTAAFLAIAAVSSVAIAAVVARGLVQPPIVSYAASALGLLVLLAAMAGGHPAVLWHGLVHGPSRLLTETLPLNGTPAGLAGPVVLTWLCGAATTELLLRRRRSAAALGVPVVCFVIAYAAASSAPGRDDITGPLLLGVLALAALARHRLAEQDRGAVDVTPGFGLLGSSASATGASGRSIRRRAPGWRATVTGAVAAVTVAAALGAGVPELPRMEQHAATLARNPPKTTGIVVDPVDTIAALRDDSPDAAPRALFSVSTNRPSSGYFGIATLDDYDGGSWSFDATFHPSGGRIPAAPAGAPGAVTDQTSSQVSQHYALDQAYDLPFIPTLDRPVEVRGLAVEADAASSMILPAQATVLPSSYDVISHTPDVTLSTVASADGIGTVRGTLDSVERADTALPSGTAADIGTTVRFLATLTGQRPAPSVAFLQAASDALRTQERRVDPAATPARGVRTVATNGGTSLADVINAVTVQRSATPEQIATLFVMVARYLGVPARLVTGFRVPPGPGSSPGTIAAGTHQVTDRDGWTWAEIPVAGIGWVVADPTPAAATGVSATPPEQVQATASTLPPHQANAVPPNEIGGQHAVAKPAPIAIPRPARHSLLPLLVAAGAALLLLAALGPGLVALRRALRRRARRSTDPAALAVGAWLELLDGLSRSGMSTPDGATTTEVATSAGQHFGSAFVDPVEETGAVADQALFATSSPPDRQSAQRAWEQQQTVRREILGTLDRRQRTRALLSVGHAPRRPGPPRPHRFAGWDDPEDLDGPDLPPPT